MSFDIYINKNRNSTELNNGVYCCWKPLPATPITSSPFLIALSPSFGDVNVLKATKLAEDPEFTERQYFTPKKAANFSLRTVY